MKIDELMDKHAMHATLEDGTTHLRFGYVTEPELRADLQALVDSERALATTAEMERGAGVIAEFPPPETRGQACTLGARMIDEIRRTSPEGS
jgi:hypothetical protein